MSALDKLLAKQGRTRAELAKDPRTRLGKLLRRGGVPDSPEVQRVRALPRAAEPTQEELDELHALVQLPSCQERLRSAQARALLELLLMGSLFAPLQVGAGKTLVSLIAPLVLGCSNALLLVPASLRDKTKRDCEDYKRRGWRVELPTIRGYEEMALESRADELDKLDPDLVIADEAHKLRNLDAAVTRRLERWLAEHPEVPLVLMSGTLISTQLVRWHHLVEWTHGPERMPLPASRDECALWGQALDEPPKDSLGPSLELGALSWTGGREGFAKHVLGTPGIVGTTTQEVGASIEVRAWRPPRSSAEVREAMRLVKEEGTRPDGELLSDSEMIDCLQQLALGFYYVWDPPPPEGWREARSEWLDVVSTYKRMRRPGLDTELQIKNHLRNFVDRPQDRAVLDAWEEAQRRYKPPRKAVWLDDSVLRSAMEHACKHNALVWHTYKAVGDRFEQLGLKHFGEGGYDRRGLYIEDHNGPASLSRKANCEGKNLQFKWNHNLVLTVTPNPEPWEQLIGRTHRSGQRADAIYVDVNQQLDYHVQALARARSGAEHLSKMTKNKQKLALATWAI